VEIVATEELARLFVAASAFVGQRQAL